MDVLLLLISELCKLSPISTAGMSFMTGGTIGCILQTLEQQHGTTSQHTSLRVSDLKLNANGYSWLKTKLFVYWHVRPEVQVMSKGMASAAKSCLCCHCLQLRMQFNIVCYQVPNVAV